MNKFLKIILLSIFAVFLLSGAASAVPFPTSVADDTWAVAQGGSVNGIPTARDNNDGEPDINDAVNLLIGAPTYDRNFELDPFFIDPDTAFKNAEDSFVALIGRTASNLNTIGFYTDLGTGNVKTPLITDSGFGFTGSGTSGDPFPGAVLNGSLSVGQEFGFYLESNTNTFFSQAGIPANADAFDHMMVFDLTDDLQGFSIWVDFGPSGVLEKELFNPILVVWEDKVGGGDEDYDDMIYLFGRVNPIPEPTTMLFLGSGLLGLVVAGRKKFFKKS
jgi:hypothetical protein